MDDHAAMGVSPRCRSTRPTSADAAIKNDSPNEHGVPNHQPNPTMAAVDNHDSIGPSS